MQPSDTHFGGERASTASALWRYSALDRGQNQRCGQMVAGSPADVRASLRRIGLQALDVRPVRTRISRRAPRGLSDVSRDLMERWHRHRRARRGASRAELYDSLATMLGAGLPLLEAVQTLIETKESNAQASSPSSRSASMRSMLLELRERLRDGDALAQAMRGHPGWFDAIDIAMIEAGQHGGNLSSVLANLAQRQERSDELSHRLWGALAYPLLVLLVGLGVVVFLSVKTLPDLTKILVDANIPVPLLTRRVMWFGQTLAGHWLMILGGIVTVLLLAMILPRLLRRVPMPANVGALPKRLRLAYPNPPRIFRQLMVGSLVGGLAELLRSGVPMVEALRVLAPTQRSARLRRHLVTAADRLERGDDLAAALHDPAWMDTEMQRLLEIGQASGELEEMLTRIGERYQRRAKRLIDHLTVLLEPAVLLLLAALVGVVVMAAILPLLSLQEII